MSKKQNENKHDIESDSFKALQQKVVTKNLSPHVYLLLNQTLCEQVRTQRFYAFRQWKQIENRIFC